MLKASKKGTKIPLFNVTDEVRITRHDVYNISIEQLTEVTKKSGEVKQEWQTIGYYPDVNTALKGVIRKNLIVDEKEVKSIGSYYKQMEDQINYLAEVIRKNKKR